MENVSENKRKRGRPPTMYNKERTRKQEIDILEKMGMAEGRTERTKVNHFYLIQAQIVLSEGDFSYLLVVDHIKKETKIKKITILQELGRLTDDDLIREIAGVICQNKLNTETAVTYIRQFRIAKKKGDSFKLAVEIGSVIDSYKFRHLDVDMYLIESSLSTVYKAFSEKFSDNL